MGVKSIEFIETDWQNFGLGLKQAKYDLSIAGTFKTDKRAEIVDFTEPLFYLGNGALVKQGDNRFQTIDDFDRADISIAVVIGEQGHEYAIKHLTRPTLKTLTGSDLSNACLEVQTGRADAALTDQYIIRRFIAENPGYKDALENNPYYVLPICWAVRKGDKNWLKLINSQITKLKESSWLNELQNYYPMITWAEAPSSATASTDIKIPAISPLGLFINYVPTFISGIKNTVIISFFSILIGTVIGILSALMLASKRKNVGARILKTFLNVCVYSLLAIPALVLIIMLYYNNILIGLNSSAVAIIALGFNLSPFAAKIIATGIKNIEPQYLEAAKAHGYSNYKIALKFKLPMIKQSSLQPLLVQWFTTIKLSSLASVIGVAEILHRSQQVIRETYQTELSYIILVFCYVIIVVPIALIADYYENKLNQKSGSK